MSSEPEPKYLVAVVGAGPAGMFAAKTLAEGGARVALLNRDVKPGGLAEYGIFHNKLKMKNGLRKQFSSILDTPDLEYFGNVRIAQDGDMSLDELLACGFQAVLVTAGAQGTKWLGLEGEDLVGVYHAKDCVYHYNHLPPFSQQEFVMGKKVAIIGAGNVMADIAHWCIRDLRVDTVTAVVRRGPAEVKFTKKEFSIFAKNMDLEAFEAELERCRPLMESLGQDVEAAKQFILDGYERGQEPISGTKFYFDFLAQPKRMVGENGQCTGLELDLTTLEPRNGDTKAVKTGETRMMDVDSVVFCIGDKVDENFGLPLDWNEFAKSPEPRYPVDGMSYEAHDPEGERDLSKIFLAGWSRKASEGLVGAARKDGTNGADAVLRYLADVGPADATDLGPLKSKLAALDKYVVVTDDVPRLFEAEREVAEKLGVEEFKYDTNDEMLAAIGAKQTA